MKSRLTKNFRRYFDRLTEDTQEQARKAYTLWLESPYHGSLQFKRVSQREPIYSVRIGLSYRALGLLEGETIYWFWVGSHGDYDELVKRL